MTFALVQAFRFFGVTIAFIGAVSGLTRMGDSQAETSGIILFLFGVSLLILSHFLQKSANKKVITDDNNIEKAIQEIKSGRIPALKHCSISLWGGEKAFSEITSYLVETKKQATQEKEKHSSEGTDPAGYVSEKHSGRFIVTNQRVVFSNKKHGFDIPLSRITNLYTTGEFLMIQTGSVTYKLYVVKPRLFEELIRHAGRL